MPDYQDQKQELRNKARELDEFASNLNGKFDALKRQQMETAARLNFFSRYRKDLWRMPAWLWIPLVALLAALFVLALVSIGAPRAT